jgi:hypothetical protein
MFVKNSYASYDNNLVEKFSATNVVGPPAVYGPPVNYVAGPIILIKEELESEFRRNNPKIKNLIPFYPNRITHNSKKYFSFAVNDIKKYAIFTLYYTKSFEGVTHNEKDVFYKYENNTKILEGNQNNPTGNQDNLLANIKIDVNTNIVYFYFNADKINADVNNTRILYIHAHWWD